MTHLRRYFVLLALLLLTCLAGCGGDSDSQPTITGPNDSAALSGVEVGKGFFDINIGVDLTMPEAAEGKLALYLGVIKQTVEGLENQGVAADIVVAFRGMAVMLITETTSEEIQAAVSELTELGVKFEACNIATGIFGVDNATILPEIKVVGNTFISAIGYQAKGYSPILIQ